MPVSRLTREDMLLARLKELPTRYDIYDLQTTIERCKFPKDLTDTVSDLYGEIGSLRTDMQELTSAIKELTEQLRSYGHFVKV